MLAKHPHSILKKYWGYSSFREKQLDIIESVLEGEDIIGLLPTGGGKSVCFQVPGLLLDGITIVISPIIALMQDQVASLKLKGISAELITSADDFRNIDRKLDNCIYGDVKFLYVSPERLKTTLFIERFKKMNVALITVDEAHCISQWGHDFRPAYLDIHQLKILKPDCIILALTATATPKVIQDINAYLFGEQVDVISKSFSRPNLQYQTQYSFNKISDTIRFLKNNKGSGIIYTMTRKTSVELSKILNSEGYSTDYYHAGLGFEERKRKQEEWKCNQTRVIIATNAFGMGIDKPDVRFVLHFDLPLNLESYTQEAGRAGRDEKPAKALLLYTENDKLSLRKKIENSFPETDVIRKVYKSLGDYYQLAIGSGEGESFPFNLDDFCKRFSFGKGETYYAIKQLTSEGHISFSDSFYNPSKVKVLVSGNGIVEFRKQKRKFDAFLEILSRFYPSIYSTFTNIDEDKIANALKISSKEVVHLLKRLEELQLIHYDYKNNNSLITWTLGRQNYKYIQLNKSKYNSRRDDAYEKANWMIRFFSDNRCRNQIILEYFGQQVEAPCGSCDFCLGDKKTILEKEEILDLIDGKSLKDFSSDLSSDVDKSKVASCLNELLETGRLRIKEGIYNRI